MFIFLIFLLGLFIGSFLGVVIDREAGGKSFIKGRSHCDSCKKELSWMDLIPVLSFLILKGKCRYCHKKLSLYYPIIELSTGILFVVTYLFIISNFPFGFAQRGQFQISNELLNQNSLIINLIYYLLIVSSFIVIFFEDLKFGIIPDKVVFPAIAIALAYLFIIHNSLFIIHLSSAIGACAFFLILFLITKGKGMGFGDVKLAFLLGLILGFPEIILALYLAFLTGAFVGIILILLKKKKSIKETIPFGPFLVTGSLLSLFLGDLILPGIISFLGI